MDNAQLMKGILEGLVLSIVARGEPTATRFSACSRMRALKRSARGRSIRC